jgi:hypothetical protein
MAEQLHTTQESLKINQGKIATPSSFDDVFHMDSTKQEIREEHTAPSA